MCVLIFLCKIAIKETRLLMRDLESNGVSGLHLKKRELSNGASNHTVFHDCNYQYHLQIKSSVVIIIMIAIKSVIIAINQLVIVIMIAVIL